MKLKNIDQLRDLIMVTHDADREAVLDILARSGALLNGHFELQSGSHSNYFLRFSNIGWDQALVRDVATRLRGHAPFALKGTTLLCPESAGFLLGHALSLQVPDVSLAVTRVDASRRPIKTLRTGQLRPDRPVVIVNDAVTTGRSLQCLIEFARENGCEVIGLLAFAAIQETVVKKLLQDLKLPGGWLISSLWQPYQPGSASCPRCKEDQPLLPAWEFN